MYAKFKIITAMLIWGSIGLFVKNIPLSSVELAFFRALIGCLFLIIIGLMLKHTFDLPKIRQALPILIISGVAISVNWICLFQAYKYTTVSIATLSYYFAPVFVILFSPIIFKEKLTLGRLGCVVVAMIGLFFILDTNALPLDQSFAHAKGISYGLAVATLYAAVMILNKFIKNLSGFDTTVLQLSSATVVLLGYIFLQDGFDLVAITAPNWFLIITLGIVHTGVAYLLFFSAIPQISGQSLAILSYVDPISAMIFAGLLLNEALSPWQLLGGLLVLGPTFLNEWLSTKQH